MIRVNIGCLVKKWAVVFAFLFFLPGILFAATQNIFDPKYGMNFRYDHPLEESLRDLNSGRIDASLNKALSFLDKNSESAPAHEIIGTAYVLKGDVKKGLDWLRRAVELDKNSSSALTKIGDVFFAEKADEKAKGYFIKALEVNSQDRRAHQRLGLLFESAGDIEAAINHFEQGLVGTSSEYVGIKVNLGRLYNRVGKFNEVINLLDDPINKKSQNATAHLVIGTAKLKLGEYGEAVEHFDQVRQIEPKSERGYLSLGIAYRSLGRFEESLVALKQVIQIKPDWLTGYYQLAETYFSQESFDQALKNYEEASRLSSGELYIQKRIADVYIAQSDYQGAIDILVRIEKTGRANLEVLDTLGSAYQLSGSLEKAEQAFLRLNQLSSGSVYSNYRLGIFYGYIKQYDKAIERFEKALESDPGDGIVLKALSVAYRQNNNPEKELATVKELFALDKSDVGNHFLLASRYQSMGEIDLAIREYSSILDSHSSHVASLNNLSMLLLENNDTDRALVLAEKAVALASDNAIIMDTYGWVLFNRNDLDGALTALKKSVDLNPHYPNAFYHLGAVYQAKGNLAQARENLQKALALSRSFSGAQKAEMLLKQLDK